jgi:hypothetical protein
MGKRKHETRPDMQEELKARDPERELSAEELDAQEAAELPDREAMSLINANIAIPVNAAVAANVLSDGATAYADAVQQTPIDQGNLAPPPTTGS